MSNSRKASNPKPLNIETGEEILDGDTLDGTPPTEPKVNAVKHFFTKHKTWFIVTGAATAGFVAHGFLARPDTCTLPDLEDLDDEDIVIEPIED